jgi:DNA repair protein RadC
MPTLRRRHAIKDWPEDERPRERLIKYGEENLSDSQLLAIILGTGSGVNRLNALDLGRSLLDHYGDFRSLDSVSVSELCAMKGVGPAKAAQVKAALEIGKRLLRQKTKPREQITSAEDVVDYYRPYLRDLKKEVFKMMLLDSRNKMIREKTVSEGSLNASVVHPREVIKEIIRESASSVVFIHNHPSGEPKPTRYDVEITKRLVKACNLVGVRVIDHIIIGDDRYVSFSEEGFLEGI